MSHINRKTVVGEQYDSSETLLDLILNASEHFLEAVIPIMFSIKGPKRGELILKVMKFIKPQSYLSYWNRNNKLFSACLIFVVNQFRTHVMQTYQFLLDYEIVIKIIIATGIVFSKKLGMDEYEEKMFQNEIKRSIIAYCNAYPIETNELVKNIINSHGKKLSKDDLVRLTKEIFAKDPSSVIEPHSFIRNYQRFTS